MLLTNSNIRLDCWFQNQGFCMESQVETPRLLDQVRQVMRVQLFSLHAETETGYWY